MDRISPAAIHRMGIPGALLLGAWMASASAGAEPQVEGRVRLASGAPAPGAQVRLFDLTRLRAAPIAASTDESGRFELFLEGLSAEPSTLPDRFDLGANYPNPFNPSTTIPYQLPAATHVKLEVFNVLGQRVATLVDGVRPAGFHTVRWDATDESGQAAGAGVYLYRFRGGGVSLTGRMVLIDGQAGIPAGGPASAAGGVSATTGDGPVYGLTVSGPGLVPYIDPRFRAGAGSASVDLVVEALDSVPRGKAATGETRLLGDVDNNGRIDMADALLVILYSLDSSVYIPNDGIISLGDVNGDGRINGIDGWLIAVYTIDPADPALPSGIGEEVALPAPPTKIYWTDWGTDKIQRSNLDGSQVEDLVTESQNPAGLSLDMAGGKMYWTNYDWANSTGGIRRSNLDGSRVEDLVAGLEVPYGVVLDVAGGKMYWTDYHGANSTARIRRSNLDGTQIEDLVTGFGTSVRVFRVTLDVAGGRMYWTDYDGDNSTGRIRRSNLDGTQVEDLVTGPTDNSGLALDVTARKMYWGNWEAGKIQYADLDGSQAGDLITGLTNPSGLALDLVRGKIYWADQSSDKIQRSNLDGSQIEDLVTTGLENPFEIALGGSYGKMYWADWTSDKIQRSNRDGTQIEDLVTTGLENPFGVALDLAGGRMYWTDFGTDKIQRANLDGSRVEDLITGLTNPAGLALDLAAGQMYWTDFGTDKIQRANLDGSGVEDLITGELRSPTGLALDLAGGKMYWTDYSTDKIQRANLDGSRVEDLITTGLSSPRGLGLDASEGKIYWVDSGTDKIQRANLDGSQIEDLVATGLEGPAGIVLDTPAARGPAALLPNPATVALGDDGTWHRFSVRAPEPVDVVVNPAGTDRIIEISDSSGEKNNCPAEEEDGFRARDGDAIYLSGCGSGTGTVELRRASDSEILRTYTLMVEDTPDDHGDNRSEATTVTLGIATQGELGPNDVDYFRLEVPGSGDLAAYTASEIDTYGHLEDSAGTELAKNDDSGEGSNFRVSARVQAGTYYIRVRGFSSRITGPYTLFVLLE